MDIDDRLTEVFRAVFDDESIELRASMTAADIEGWDSIAHISLVYGIEEEFGIKLSTKDLRELENVGDIQRVVARRSGA